MDLLSSFFPPFNNYHMHVLHLILPYYLDFYSLLVKIILTTQLASTLSIAQRLGGAVTVLLALCFNDLITVYSQTKLYFQVLWLWQSNPSVDLAKSRAVRSCVIVIQPGKTLQQWLVFIVCCH